MVFCGNDITSVARMKKAIEKGGKTFLEKVFTQDEIKYCESKKAGKYRSYAARFAAKEAMYKALSQFINEEYNYTDYEVIKDKNGKPIAKFNGSLSKIKAIKNIKSHDLSLSHEGTYAIASYVVEI